ncbi:MAG: hypothetical protein QOE23_969 [Pseudonocardiales bacterium]|nr:hypothetical protein [Pseudonocardiales bacterium]
MSGALVLNATYEPLCVVPLRRAVLHSARLVIEAPTVVRLSRFVRVPYRSRVPLTRRAVMHRDGLRCAYCQRRADTIDHVVPRSRGGKHEWVNVVAACATCNHRKADRLLAELGWSLPFTPREPAGYAGFTVGYVREPAWEPYLDAWGNGDQVAS